MEDKYNQLHLERYSKQLANLLCDRHFATHDTLNGPQLLGFTPIKQVNLFVIKELLLKWHHEMANLRSPYFDYEHEEVKEALVNFMNVLSRKILMKRNAFEPLLQKAIYDTFLVVLAPVTTFEEKFLRIQEEITLPKLQENLKYIDIDKALFAGFVETLSPNNRDREYILSRFTLYVKANPDSRTPLSKLVEKFNSLLPVTEEEIKGTTPAAPAPVPVPKATPAAPARETEIVAPIHNTQREASAPTARPMYRKAEEDEDAEDAPVNVRPTLNDNFRKASSASLAESHTNRKIESLKNSISINQRFSFINELFNGDNMAYYQAIKTLDDYPAPEVAKRYVTQDLASKYDWSKKQDHVSKLLRLIERKFA
ncbi:hypothetical protein CLV24_11350 [Pontibacter ummariensis]|uniref:Uncharacterized protein n=1 Tax=Pontibacter ummariensis TaxID=1610492 RepID=A0A239HET1_9BACT|nr:hypothetical protein [Pontibacter ummariensis]PRY10631.1 hypothetical protein CLV24_11350 [Pontibacter ummariensis]SNS79538.1 hypothetical protein SAMN06296052_113105 [Pontibacter ummariensis]